MVHSLCKNWLLVSKITWGICTTSDKQWKVQKVEIWWATFIQKIHLSKKYIPSAKTLYTPNYLCHFWNDKPFFKTQLLCIMLAQTLHTFYESSPSKCQFLDFPLLGLKFTKFLMSSFKQKVSCSSKCGHFFSVMRDNSVLF